MAFIAVQPPGQNPHLDALITELYYRLALLRSVYVSTDSKLQPPKYRKAPGSTFVNDYGINRQAWMLPMEGTDKTLARRVWGK